MFHCNMLEVHLTVAACHQVTCHRIDLAVIDDDALEFLANILASLSSAAASEGTARTVLFNWDEPECPEELI